MADTLSQSCTVTVKNANEVKPDIIRAYDTIILGTPSWKSRGEEGMPTEVMLRLLDVWKTKKLRGKSFALFGCGDDSYATFCGAVDKLEDFVKSAGGNLVMPSLRINGFFFYLDKNIALAKSWAADLEDNLTSLLD